MLLIGIAAALWILMQRSLPPLDGMIAVERLSENVTIERDARGIPTIKAGNREDLAFGTGFVHGQDRFFQMDLTRRQAAGELSEMFGPPAVAVDRSMRWHRFRSRARIALASIGKREAAALEAYAAGVNAGLESLRSRPFEYLVLNETPRAWQPEDSLLVAYAMFLDLNDGQAIQDVQRGYAARVLPAAVFDWLYPAGTRWDAPLTGPASRPAPVPGPEIFHTDRSKTAPQSGTVDHSDLLAGSNNWAVAGWLTRDGRAIVANDMHLRLAAPNVFYRARLVQTGERARDLSGVTLPGVPILVAGSNGRVAWALTNSYGDWSDAVIVRPGSVPSTYRTADGDVPFDVFQEAIGVRGAANVTLAVRETRWGPVLEDVPWADGKIAVSWIGHKADAVNLLHLELETATTVHEALEIAKRLGAPPQNFVCGDDAGNIGWTIAGKIPLRADFDASLPADWSLQEGWHGWLPSDAYPQLINPPTGRIWTANARAVDGEALSKIGDGGYDLGARASQIRDQLFAAEEFEEIDMLAIQLDDRALFLTPWRDLLLRVLDDAAVAGNPQRQTYRQLAEGWLPRASAESVGYRLVRAFRIEVRTMVFSELMQSVRDAYTEEITLRISNQFEAPLWSLVNEQPSHLLPPEFDTWRELLLAAVDHNIERFDQEYDDGLDRRSWGEFNTASIRHPLSRSMSAVSRWLDMPRQPLDGDSNVPRVVRPDFGASERFAVSPGNEKNGYLHMPSGQSGHPYSDYYRAGHDDWVRGRATPFLPGATVHTLTLSSTGH